MRCPWCSNADLARGVIGVRVPISKIASIVEESALFVDYFHVTGGEPTLQLKPLMKLYTLVKERTGLLLSMDTNATIPSALKKVIPLLHHVAIDVKAPLHDVYKYAHVTGVSAQFMKYILPKIREGILIAARVPFLELRTTLVPRLISCDDVIKIARELEELFSNVKVAGRVVYVVQQFIPYEGVKGEYSKIPRVPSEYVRECARKVLQHVSVLKVYYRTLEEGSRAVAT